MNIYTLLVSGAVWMTSLAVTGATEVDTPRSRVITSFDADWLFLKGDTKGADKPDFDDSSWQKINVPHDWSIEGPFNMENKTGGAGGFLPAGIGWYRKHFTLSETDAKRRVFVEFDGVMANSEVWINGKWLGFRPFGYVSFCYDLTPYLNFEKDKVNVLTVKADDSAQPASRWYAGAGIYRHVRLIVTDAVHLDNHATFVSTPSISQDAAIVRVQTRVVNSSDTERKCVLTASITGLTGSASDGGDVCSGKSAEVSIPAGKTQDVSFDVKMPGKPKLWELDRPELHQAFVKVESGSETMDEERVAFGIREFHFDADTGFSLNGKNLKLKGVCLHHDGGAFGAAVPLGVWEQRLSRLKELGCNAIRTSHNPVAPEFLDLCDRMGFLVMDEMFDCWTVGKNPYDYHLYFNEWFQTDARDTVRRDRNHPCIVLYSAGNEIHDTPHEELAKSILGMLIEVFHAEDPTRPVTQALFRPNASHDYTNGLADMLDVVGQNYRERELLNAHRDKPSRKIVGTENQHARVVWLALRENPFLSGEFLWTGVDYIGESRRWPDISRPTGLLDRTGGTYPRGYERQSWWSEKPMVFAVRRTEPPEPVTIDPGYEKIPPPPSHKQVIFADWTPANVAPHDEDVEIYSNAEQVELLLNGKSLGAKTHPADDSPRTWKVAFEPGRLEAVARSGDQIVARHELRTAGKPAKLLLSVDREKLRPRWDDVAFVRVEIVDENGVLVPNADNLVEFKISGPGVIAAVDNADNASHESFQDKQRHAYQGRCVALLKAVESSGEIVLEASAQGLAGGVVRVQAAPEK